MSKYTKTHVLFKEKKYFNGITNKTANNTEANIKLYSNWNTKRIDVVFSALSCRLVFFFFSSFIHLVTHSWTVVRECLCLVVGVIQTHVWCHIFRLLSTWTEWRKKKTQEHTHSHKWQISTCCEEFDRNFVPLIWLVFFSHECCQNGFRCNFLLYNFHVLWSMFSHCKIFCLKWWKWAIPWALLLICHTTVKKKLAINLTILPDRLRI